MPLLAFAIKFLLALVMTTIVLTVSWGVYFPGRIYWRNDETGFDFLSPGDWAHGTPTRVSSISPENTLSMPQPDLLHTDWPLAKLWRIWWALLTGGLIVSLLLASLRWTSLKQISYPPLS